MRALGSRRARYRHAEHLLRTQQQTFLRHLPALLEQKGTTSVFAVFQAQHIRHQHTAAIQVAQQVSVRFLWVCNSVNMQASCFSAWLNSDHTGRLRKVARSLWGRRCRRLLCCAPWRAASRSRPDQKSRTTAVSASHCARIGRRHAGRIPRLAVERQRMAEILGSEPTLSSKPSGREVIEVTVGRGLADLNKAFADTTLEIGIGQTPARRRDGWRDGAGSRRSDGR